MSHTAPVAAALLAALLATAASAGEVWRWQDKSGGWHFGDRPPPGAAAEWYDTSRSRSTADPAEIEAQRRRNDAAAGGMVRDADQSVIDRRRARDYDRAYEDEAARLKADRCASLRSIRDASRGDRATELGRQYRQQCQ